MKNNQNKYLLSFLFFDENGLDDKFLRLLEEIKMLDPLCIITHHISHSLFDIIYKIIVNIL